MSIISWKPFNDIDELVRESELKIGFSSDLYEDDDNVIVEMHLPGINPDKVDIDVEESYVRISGKREEDHETKDRHYYQKEIRRGSFERVIHLPCAVVAEKTRADMKDGVLRVLLPKQKETKSSKVRVNKG